MAPPKSNPPKLQIWLVIIPVIGAVIVALIQFGVFKTWGNKSALQFSGVVVDSDKTAISLASIQIVGFPVHTSDDNGSFNFEIDNNSGETNKKVTLIIKHPGFNTLLQEITLPSSGQTYILSPKQSGRHIIVANGPRRINLPVINLTIGEKYKGGIIFHLEDNKKHGWIAAENDQSLDAYWMIGAGKLPSNVYSTIDGLSNTQNVIAEKGNAGAYAAKMCMDYRGGGFNDWFLPAQDQLDTLFFYRKKIGGFSERIYWTSTGNGDNVWVQDFKGGEKGVDFPTNRHSVRSIRVF